MKNLIRFWRAVVQILCMKKVWHWPKRSDVLVFDVGRNPAYDQCLEQMLQPYTVECLPLLDREVNVPVLLASLIRQGSRKDAYNDFYIRKVRPKLVLTYVDNHAEFYLFSIRNPTIKSMFIQNGTRGYFADVFEILDKEMSGVSLKVDYMLTFGSRIGAEYSKYIAGTVVPMGSFRNNLVPVRRKKIKNTIAFVSQYRDTQGFYMGGVFYGFQEFWEQTDKLILGFLVDYATANGKSLFIIPCSGHHKDPTLLEKETKYYNNLVGFDFAYSEWEWHGSSYDAIDSAEVVVSIDSSMGVEAAARGTKSANFFIRSRFLAPTAPPSLSYGWPGSYPDDGPYWTNRPDPAAFQRILDHLFAISDEEWRFELEQHNFPDVMAYDPGCSILKSILLKELGPGRSH